MIGGDCRRSCCHCRRCHDSRDIIFVHDVVRQLQSRKDVSESSAGGPPRRISMSQTAKKKQRRSSVHHQWTVGLPLPVLVPLMLMMIFVTKNDCLLSSIFISTVRGFVPNTSNWRIVISTRGKTRGHMDAPAGRIRGQYRSSLMTTMIENSVQPTEEEDSKVQSKSKSKKRKTKTTKIARKSKSKSTKRNKSTVTSTAKTKDTAAGQKKKKNDFYYWSDESDPVMIVKKNLDDSNHHQVSKLRFKVRGNPRPLQRHRTSRGFMYNPSLKYQRSFERVVVDDLLVGRDDTSDDDTLIESRDRIRRLSSSLVSYPVFGPNEYLAMTLVFKMKRPLSHFINNRPGPGRLKPTAPGMMSSTIRTDIDNLVKFVLDSMNSVLYEDDRQVTSIQATKVFDNDDTCDGSIELCIHKIDNDDEMDEIIRSMVQ
mmetsp:Transcript_18073/g.43748  ORF Transcript_18073/g.43748 Transcript_18073/m.43748 type:complete len:425 (-) Transcript_18073:244-1518(-)